MNKFIFALVFFFTLASSTTAQTLWEDLLPGTYHVGFKVEHTYDYSRTFVKKVDSTNTPIQGERARPIQFCMWYPVIGNDKLVPMNYEEYVWLFATELTGGKINDSIKASCKKEMEKSGFYMEHVEQELKKKVYAIKNGPIPKEKFPLIIYGTSWSAPAYENHVLYEYLASHGYVVVACPSMGQYTRDMTGDLTGVESQVQDMQFMINKASQYPFVDMNKIATAGFSWGGLTNVFLQMRNNKIKAVVSYDGSIANPNGMNHFKNSPFCDFSKMDVPFMYMSAKGRKSHPFYDKLNYSDAWYLTFHKNQHRDFASDYITTVNKYPSPDKEKIARNCYSIQCRYTLNFFNAYVKDDAEAKKFMNTPTKDLGIADTIMTYVNKKARALPPSPDFFMRMLQKDGLPIARELFRQVHKADPDYKLFTESSINSMAYGLLRKEKVDEAIEYFLLNTEAYPDSPNVFDSLGDAYEKKGDKEKARECYKKALELDVKFPGVAEKLEKLK